MGHPDPIAFTIFGIDIRWYGILIAFGMLLAVLISCRRAPRHGITDEDVLDIAIWMLPIGVIGARVYYVIFNLDYYKTLSSMLDIRSGGLAIHGGLIFSAITIFVICRKKKIDPFNVFDLFVKVHPTFLYESIWCLILFIALSWFNNNKRYANGQTIALYCIFYSLERFLVEALRTDSLMIGPFKQAQVISVCAIILGIFLYRYASVHKRINASGKE